MAATLLRWRWMTLSALVGVLGICGVAAARAAGPEDPTSPHLRTQGTATQLVVDGKPFLVLAGELNNSSASSLEHMKPIWPRLVGTNLNTVIATVSWELIEPEEGKFDFAVVDGLIRDARENKLHLIFLWFASWKNGVSSYPPLRVKLDPGRFPLVCDKSGKFLDILSPLGEATRDADARAFAALMHHLREVDGKQHTVLMMQVENEVGVLGDSRDRSEAANKAFSGPVPGELTDYLRRHRDTLVPEFREVWQAAGGKTSGSWEDLFGPGKPDSVEMPVRTLSPPMTPDEHETTWRKLHWPVDEIFMAWHYSRYVNKVVEAGKAEYPIPMFVNAWLQQRDHAWPGTYPSGGPVPQVADVWRAGAPALDFQAPDLYVGEFAELCSKFTRSGNPLFIPETGGGARGAVNALYAFGQHNAIGFSPFGIDRMGFGPGGPAPAATEGATLDEPLAQCYAALAQLAPVIAAHQGEGDMVGVMVGPGALPGSEEQTRVELGNYTLTVRPAPRGRFGPGGPGRGPLGAAGDAQPTGPTTGGALIIALAPDDFVILSSGVSLAFKARSPGPGRTAYASIDEGSFADGRWVRGRRLNGDQTGHNTRLPLGNLRIVRVKLYQHP